MDYDAFEKAIVENDVKMFILCNPYNPIGKVWKEDELKQIENTIDNFNKSDYSTMGIICKTKSQAKQIYDKLKINMKLIY